MNQTLSAMLQALTPPIVWNAYLRLRGHARRHPWRDFGGMATNTNVTPLVKGKFAEIYTKYQPLDPFIAMDVTRYRHYNICFLGSLCRSVPGDFLCAGVSFGLAPRILYDFLDFATLNKTLHLVDPFEGIASSRTGAISAHYNRDPDFVLNQYPAGAPIVLHRERVPMNKVPGKLAFVFADTGDAVADAAALPDFYEALSPGGIFITNQYANDLPYYEQVLKRLGVTPFWFPSGQGAIFKP